MPEEKLIGPVDVVRNEDGYWYHPGIPDFDENAEAWKAWLDAQGLRVVGWHMDADLESHPYWDEEACNCLGWDRKSRRLTTGSCSRFSIPRTAPTCSGRPAR